MDADDGEQSPPGQKRTWPLYAIIAGVIAALLVVGFSIFAMLQFLRIFGCIMMLGLPPECGALWQN